MGRKGVEREIARRKTAATKAAGARVDMAPRPDDWLDREQRAAMAEHAYLSIGPQVRLGKIPSVILERWRGAIELGRPSPTRNFTLASIDIEKARALVNEVQPDKRDDTFSPKIVSDLDKAGRTLDLIGKDRDASDSLKLQAALVKSGLGFYSALLRRADADELLETRQTFLSKHRALTKYALARVRGSNSLPDEVMQVLTLATVLNEGKHVTMPALARFAYPKVDREHASQLYVLGLDASAYIEFQVQLSPEKRHGVVCVDPSDLLQDRLPEAGHSYGTLAVFADPRSLLPTQAHGMKGKSLSGGVQITGDVVDAKVKRIREHGTQVNERLQTVIWGQLEDFFIRQRVHDRDFKSPIDAVKWYANLSAYHQFEPYLPRLQEAVAMLDEVHQINNLDQIEVFALAWMHVELAMAEAREGKIGVEKHFRKAEVLFDSYASNANRSTDRLGYFQGLFDKAAVPIYQAIALQDGSLESKTGTYNQTLLELAQRMHKEKQELEIEKPSQAAQLGQLIDEITTVLLLTTEKSTLLFAAPSSLRQSVDDLGLVVWLETNDVFRSDYFGYVSLPYANPEGELVTNNIPYLLNIPDGHILFDDISSYMRGEPDTNGRDERLSHAREAIREIVDSIED